MKIKEGGGMDFQKEREAFEKLSEIAEILKNKTIKFVEKTNKYYSYHYSVEYLNGAWMAWQAQAVPEWISVGDSLPPVDETVLVCWDYAADIEPEKEYLTLDEDYNEYWPNCQDEPPTHWLPLPKVIKAQEPANV